MTMSTKDLKELLMKYNEKKKINILQLDEDIKFEILDKAGKVHITHTLVHINNFHQFDDEKDVEEEIENTQTLKCDCGNKVDYVLYILQDDGNYVECLKSCSDCLYHLYIDIKNTYSF